MSGDVPAERFVGLGLAGIVPVLLFASFARPIQLLLIGALTGANGWIVGWVTRRARGLDPARLGVPCECEPARGIWRGLQPDGVSLVPARGPSRGPGPWAGTARAEGSVGPSKSIPGGTVLPRRGGMASAPRPTPATSRRATTTRRERLLARLRGNVRRALRIRSVFYDVLGAINVETRKETRGNNERLIRSSEP